MMNKCDLPKVSQKPKLANQSPERKFHSYDCVIFVVAMVLSGIYLSVRSVMFDYRGTLGGAMRFQISYF